MLRHELSSLPVRLLLSVLVLIDAGRYHYALPGVDPVVSHESGDFADDGYKALLYLAPCLAHVSHALIPSYRSVHSFCVTSSSVLLLHRECFLDTPLFTHYSSTMTGIERPVYSANGLFLAKR